MKPTFINFATRILKLKSLIEDKNINYEDN